MNRTVPALRVPAARSLLARILDVSGLETAVPTLDPAVLGAVVKRVGLEDAGELVALATPAQLQHLLDEDLWTAAPGQEEKFDVARFARWIEVMVERGDDVAADRLAELPEDLVVLGLHGLVVVIEVAILPALLGGPSSRKTEAILDGGANLELARYVVIARDEDSWDAVQAVIVALDDRHPELAEQVFDRLFEMVIEEVDEAGLDHVVTRAGQVAVDAAAEREDRRASQGFVAPWVAVAFLERARSGDDGGPMDVATSVYFRDLDRAPPTATATPAPDADEPAGELMDVLRASGVVPDAVGSPRPLLTGDAAEDDPGRGLLDGALAELATRAPSAHQQRLEELAFLVNVLVAGCPLRGERFTTTSAAEAALATCNLGLQVLLGAAPTPERGAARLVGESLDRSFRAGWHRLHRTVGKPARRQKLRGPIGSALADDCPHLVGEDGEPRFVGTLAELDVAVGVLRQLTEAPAR